MVKGEKTMKPNKTTAVLYFIITILFLIIQFLPAQEVKETKIDSVAIMAEMETLFSMINEADRQIEAWKANKDHYAHTYNWFSKMLVPKVKPVVEEEKD